MSGRNGDVSLKDVLSKSTSSFHTVILESTYRADSQITGPAFARRVRVRESAEAGTLITSSRPGAQVSGLQLFSTSRIWWRKPACLRHDVNYPGGGTAVSVVCNQELSDYVSWLGQFHTTRRPVRTLDRMRSSLFPSDVIDRRTASERAGDMPLLSSSFAMSGWHLQALGDRTHCGRNGVLFHAKWGSPGRAPTNWGWIDEYRAIVDLERGILLSCECVIDDQPAIVVSATSIEFDAKIPDSVFDFEPPRRTRTIRVRPNAQNPQKGEFTDEFRHAD